MGKKSNTSIAEFIKDLFRISDNPKKGLLAVEWVVMAYLVFTLLIIFFTYTKCVNAETIIFGRVRMAAITLALWGAYRLLPCKAMILARVCFQLAALSIWYPDIYEINRMFPNLDHLFAATEQSIFGCQPALLWYQLFPSKIVSELMYLGYFSYYPIIAFALLYYFIKRYSEFERAAFICLGTFFLLYLVYLFVGVVGPQFYYPAVGVEQIAKGIFPNMNDAFADYDGHLTNVGWSGGLFYQLVAEAHEAGERPIAAFPSSHVGVTVVVMMLIAHARAWKLFLALLPLAILLFFSTVYIQAHYLIDALAGLVSGALIYALLFFASKGMVTTKTTNRRR